jgi:hypothetical protein
MPAIGETLTSFNMLNPVLYISKRKKSLSFAAGYGGATMEPIPVMKGSFPATVALTIND